MKLDVKPELLAQLVLPVCVQAQAQAQAQALEVCLVVQLPYCDLKFHHH